MIGKILTVEGQTFATRIIDDVVHGGKHIRRKQTHPSPPVPKHSMLKRSVVTRRCEFVSVRAASLRYLYSTPTLNLRGTGATQRARCTSNAHMRALRTFVRQQSSHTSPASIVVVTAVCLLDAVMAIFARTCEAHGTTHARTCFSLGVISCHLADHTRLTTAKCRPAKARVLGATRRHCQARTLRSNERTLGNQACGWPLAAGSTNSGS